MTKSFFFIALLIALDLSAQTYWIAYGTYTDNGQNYYLFRIDHEGNVIQRPQLAFHKERFSPFSITLNQRDENTLNLWTAPSGWNSRVHRLIINKNDLRMLKEFRTHLISSAYPKLQVTKKEQNNVLLYQFDGAKGLNAVRLSESGVALADPLELYSSTNEYDSFGISADGQLLVYSEYRNVFARKVDSSGKLKESVLLARFPSRRFNGVNDMDVSNVITNDHRIVAFCINKQSISDDLPDRLFSLVLDAKTSIPRGQPALLHSSSKLTDGAIISSVSIDPHGQFLLYVEGESSIVFQKLDANGNKVGARRILVQDIQNGDLDILQD